MGMWKLKRRDFLKGLGLTGTAGAVLSGSNVWALNRLEPVGDTLASEYPYRSWEDLYRNEWSWDSVGHAAHCINCMGNCAWNVYVKDGIVIREEQIAKYPQVNPNVPDANLRGCQKGAIHSTAMYEADRLRFSLKRAGERGEGKWQRISWDQVPHHGEAVQLDAAHQRGKALTGRLAHHGLVARALVGLELAGAILLEDVDDLVGDLLGGLIPGDALPLALAALAGPLQREAQAVGLVHGRGVDRPLLAAPRVGVGHVGVHLGVLGDLLLANDDAVLHIDVPGAVAHAVDAVGGVAHAVPAPLVAVEILPAAIGVLAGQGIAHGLQPVERPDIAAAEHGAGGPREAQPLQEIAPLKLPHPHNTLLIHGVCRRP